MVKKNYFFSLLELTAVCCSDLMNLVDPAGGGEPVVLSLRRTYGESYQEKTSPFTGKLFPGNNHIRAIPHLLNLDRCHRLEEADILYCSGIRF